MPDALSKTIPIWCAVWNHLLFPSASTTPPALHLPPTTVSPSEHSQIASLLPTFLAAATSLSLPLPRLRALVRKPLRPLWVTRDSPLPDRAPASPAFHPVVLCTSSRRAPGGSEASAAGYVQGAGDDAEGWARGLTAPLWWAHRDALLAAPEAELPALIAGLVAEESGRAGGGDAVLVAPTGWVWVGGADAVRKGGGRFDAVIECAEGEEAEAEAELRRLAWPTSAYCRLRCGTGKLGSRDLRGEMAKVEAFVRDGVAAGATLAVCCPTGRDLSVGVALAVLCLYADDEGRRTAAPNAAISKAFIRQRLSWIMTAFPAASPSRATLQSVNAFLFSPRAPPPPTSNAMPATPLGQTFASLSTPAAAAPWTLVRTLTSALPTTPSGTFAGTATFTPREPTAPGYAAEYLYAEEGTLRTDAGLEFAARRRYAWRYAAEKGREGVTVWFVKDDDGASVDYLFLDMEFEGGGGSAGLRAKGRHPCGEDVYDAAFVFGGEGSAGMVVTYVVKGPRKDYVSETRYSR
ncbi:Initiator tRNA phosphoribosyl transferase [Neofusicoccum parvum]|nr:Initiator tRNA phosphoribosyl transferase [Neofusicoccum parvum]